MSPKVLVANRGEIAIRVLRTAQELGWQTVAVYSANDASHAGFADEAIELGSAGEFMDVNVIAAIAARTHCTHVHPGYGFLSESPKLSAALSSHNPPITFIGPSPHTLRVASDKMLSRELASSLSVAISPGRRVASSEDILHFAANVPYPLMIKALDGGGGRGIRIVSTAEEVDEAFKRCLGESPSRQVFVEKALTGPGWKHIEVQVIGDGTGAVNHFWERECSVQRRFQKIVETAPSRLSRRAVQPLIDASLSIARSLKYKGLGTFEFLVNAQTGEWVFLEINPRVQVEHTITEEIVDYDLVRFQLLLFTPSTTLNSLALNIPPSTPTSFAVQLRLTAEDPSRNFQLSPGSIHPADITWPAGRGVRVDTWLANHPSCTKGDDTGSWTVGTEFDSLLAKIIVRGSTFEEMTQKGLRALGELSIGGTVRTNAAVLAGVLTHPDWMVGAIDTLWLERNAVQILELGTRSQISNGKSDMGHARGAHRASGSAPGSGGGQTQTMVLQPGTVFNLILSDTTPPTKHTLMLSSIKQNAFPDTLSGTLQASFAPAPLAFSLAQSTSSAVASNSTFELADPNDLAQVATPLTGKVVELHPALVSVGKSDNAGKRAVKKGEALIVLSVMKMENTVFAPRDGYVTRVGKGVRVGVILGEGVLVCVLGSAPEVNATSKL